MSKGTWRWRSFRAQQQRKGWRLRILLVGGLLWACALMFPCLFLLWTCGSSPTVSCKKNKLYLLLGSLGFVSWPVHRCAIPLRKDPTAIQVPASYLNMNGQYPLNLTYITRDSARFSGPPLFGGYQTWKQREESFELKPNMKIHCGYTANSGGEMDEDDKRYVKNCRFVVASGIFDGYDIPHQPSNISDRSRKLFCFLMVVDEKSLKSIHTILNLTSNTDEGKWVGLWRLVLLRHSPYDEPRRNGKVPKLLTHRLFPNAEYSIWIDGKMELLVDPMLILERYLWRGGHHFAIARHKHHKSIHEEADANKRRKRYARPLIDKQVEIYQLEGMQPWSPEKLPVPSDVPEGAIIIRWHTPMTNLFSCLWFNEVNRFTPRDQLSFGYVVYRLNGSFPFFMFPNCEYNSLFFLHKHTREHSSVIEWVKSLDELEANKTMVESRGGIGLFTPYLVDAFDNFTSRALLFRESCLLWLMKAAMDTSLEYFAIMKKRGSIVQKEALRLRPYGEWLPLYK
ncbi:hypothetical protein GOP47_0023530 [Adiantum capillus-veneris]|uniref:TOD1/MUCI70 glycosyltransferase-like domain-containing protein n=1 Tax=Adiantum capillus-veneris TaxID=13818 RepID=A0A9D4U456_ADICA|nr:hypothetical protein GOP47_0023530 [Adiantum capillus-veneris]